MVGYINTMYHVVDNCSLCLVLYTVGAIYYNIFIEEWNNEIHSVFIQKQQNKIGPELSLLFIINLTVTLYYTQFSEVCR